VAEEKNISAAARTLNLTQPDLSRQIKALEDELGWKLIERGARSISLTREGEVVVREGRTILQEVEAGLERMRQAVSGVELRVGFAPSLAREFLGIALDRFAQLHPNARVSLFDRTSLEMERGIAEGELDVIIAARNESARGLRWESLRQDEWRVLLPARHALAAKEVIDARLLDGERIVLFSKEEYPEYWKTVTRFFKEQGVNAKVAGEFDGVTSLVAAVEGGMGLALLSAASHPGDANLTVARKLEPDPGIMCVAAGLPAESEVPAEAGRRAGGARRRFGGGGIPGVRVRGTGVGRRGRVREG
jgi:DNA-binding transcriptional LysR family regulator